MSILEKLDTWLIVWANRRAEKMPRNWQGFKVGKQGIWDLGKCTQREAELKILENTQHKIKMVDVAEAIIFYE